jgi:hypothetical protein
MPLLRRLYLVLDNFPASDVLAFRGVPLLPTTVLNDGAASGKASGTILPWAQLTFLTFFGVYPCECVPVLQKTFIEPCSL